MGLSKRELNELRAEMDSRRDQGMTGAERAVEMHALREQHLILEEIGYVFRLTRERVRQILGNRSASERHCEACGQMFQPSHNNARFCSEYCASLTTCPNCGGPKSRSAAHCQRCYLEPAIKRRKLKDDLLITLWAEGASLKEVAAALGTTVNALSVRMKRVRDEGRDLPHRYRMERKGP